MNKKEAREFIESLPTDRPTSWSMLTYWEEVSGDDYSTIMTPGDRCDRDNPIVAAFQTSLAVDPGDILTVYAICRSDDGEYLPAEGDFYFAALVACGGGCESREYINIESVERFTEQGMIQSFSLHLPKKRKPNLMCFQAILWCYHPGLEITIDGVVCRGGG